MLAPIMRLLIVNPFASGVSDERADQVRRALGDVEVARTEHPGHATELAQASRDAEAVYVFSGDGTFNAPPLAEAADTPPFFHNNAVDTIEAAVSFYFTQTFRDSPSSFLIGEELSADQQADLAAFLRVINASTNVDQVRKRVEYVQSVRSPGNTELLELALADLDDARGVLADKALNPDAQSLLNSAELALKGALNGKDRDRPSPLGKVLTLLDRAKATLFSAPPDGDGGGEDELE